MTPVPLGDSHNFGRRVELRRRRVRKPRPLLWEWLLLGHDSPLREWLDDVAAAAGFGPEAFGFLPRLRFFEARSHSRTAPPTLLGGGEVERLELQPLGRASAARRRELAGVLGRSLALFSFLGLSDLHWENLVLGIDGNGRIVFGPLDVELVLADLALPTQTKLLPDPDLEYAAECQHAAGARRVLPYLGKPVSAETLLVIANAYVETLALLGREAASLARLLGSLPGLRETPIRVCLRGTGDYVRALADPTSIWPPLLAAELEQLSRGDIPYFFRLYGRRGLHYFKSADAERVGRLPAAADSSAIDPMLSVARRLSSPNRRTLATDGVLALLGAFDHPELSGTYRAPALSVSFLPRSLVVELDAGPRLREPRGSSRLASSLYQPCRCGEVRSVFVPEVTKCRATAAGP